MLNTFALWLLAITVVDHLGAAVATPRTLIVWCAVDCHDLADALNKSFHENSQITRRMSDAFLSVLPLADEKTILRPNPYAIFRSSHVKSTRIHGLAEFAYGAWCEKRKAMNLSWEEVGCLFRNEMEAKNYRIDLGDLWEVNEAPQAFHRNSASRHEVAAVVSAIAKGCGNDSTAVAPGVLFLASEAQSTAYLDEYKTNMKEALKDAAAFTQLASSVVAFSQEVYTDAKSTCSHYANASTQLADVSWFVNHVVALSAAGFAIGEVPLIVNEYLHHAYAPTLNSIWGSKSRDPINASRVCHGYGDTDIDLTNMAGLVNLQHAAGQEWFTNRGLPVPRYVSFGYGAVCAKQRLKPGQLARILIEAITGEHFPNNCTVKDAVIAGQWESFSSWVL